MSLKYKFSKWYILLRFYKRYSWLRFQYYLFRSLTIPARIYCKLRGYDYLKWVWGKEKEGKKKC